MLRFAIVLISLILLGARAGADPGILALVQYDSTAHFGDEGANRRALTALADEAVANGAKIVVFPEGSGYGLAQRAPNLVEWCRPDLHWGTSWGHGGLPVCRDVSIVAEWVPGGSSSRYWADYAKRRGIYVVFSVLEDDDGDFYNTAGVAGPAGFVAKYRKRAIANADAGFASEGDSPLVLKTPYGSFGLLICADVRENYARDYRKKGVSAAIVAADWTGDSWSAFNGYAAKAGLDLFIADNSSSDGTGKYFADGRPRERGGLPQDARGSEGISYQAIGDAGGVASAPRAPLKTLGQIAAAAAPDFDGD